MTEAYTEAQHELARTWRTLGALRLSLLTVAAAAGLVLGDDGELHPVPKPQPSPEKET